MKNFCVIGNPIDHSLSPQLHNWIFKKLNINANYKKVLCNENDLRTIINKIDNDYLIGVNVTLPFKESVIEFLDEINPRVKLIGSVNCILKNNKKIIGYNTDWYGFSKLLINNKINVYNKEVIIIGAGGISKAIIYSLINNNIKKIRLFNRTFTKAKEMENSIITAYKLEKMEYFINKDSIIINCTSVGMKDNISPISELLIHENQILIDTIYNPYMTELLKIGKRKGSQVINGLDMFIYQGIASLELWLGKSINDKLNFLELKKYLKDIL